MEQEGKRIVKANTDVWRTGIEKPHCRESDRRGVALVKKKLDQLRRLGWEY